MIITHHHHHHFVMDCKYHHRVSQRSEEVEKRLALLPKLGQSHPEDDGEEDQAQDVRAVRPLP